MTGLARPVDGVCTPRRGRAGGAREGVQGA
jgi:hypothetical protein